MSDKYDEMAVVLLGQWKSDHPELRKHTYFVTSDEMIQDVAAALRKAAEDEREATQVAIATGKSNAARIRARGAKKESDK